MSLPRFGVTHPVPVNLLMAAAIFGGVVAALTLTKEFFPDITPEAAMVTLPYPGATPEEVEEGMAKKVEDALADLDEVDEIRTTLSEGGGGITVEFREGITDVRAAVDEVERAVDTLQDLPEDADRITVTEFEPTLPVIMLTLYGEADEQSMKSAIRGIRDELETLPDMGEVIVSGVRDYEIRVDVDPDKLMEHGMSLTQVADAIRAWMADVPGGSVRTSVETINIRTIGVEEEAATVRQIAIKATPGGQVLRVGDIATVTDDFVDEQLVTRFNGQPSVSLTVLKLGDQDAVKIAEMVRAYAGGVRGDEFQMKQVDRIYAAINSIRAAGSPDNPPSPLRSARRQAYDLGASRSAPLPGTLATHSDLARFIEGRLELLSRNALQGAVLVFATLLLFLNWRVAWWVGAGLVTALCGTTLLMSLTGVTLNLLTMFGLIVVLGMLVDDAIVVSENIQSRHDRGEPSRHAAIRGAEEVFWPVVGTVTTTIVAFIPLIFIKGRIGDLMGALPMVVACALSVSLIESVLILPSHMAHSLIHRDMHPPGRFSGMLRRFELWRDRIIFDRVIPAYAWIVSRSLYFRYISTAAALGVLIVSVGMIAGNRVEFTFLPSSDSETIVVDVRMPIGTAIEQTDAIVRRIEHAASSTPEATSVAALIGQRTDVESGSPGGTGGHLAQLFIELKPIELRDRLSREIIEAIREQSGPMIEAESIRYSEISGGPGGADITIQLAGEDQDMALEAAAQLKARLAEFEGVYDIADDNYAQQRELQIRLKPGAAALGFGVADVARQVRGALFGLEPHVFSASREDIYVRVRFDEQARRSLAAIEQMWVFNPAGRAVALREIAAIDEGSSFSTIRRVDRKRTVTVTADTAETTNPEEIVRAMQGDILAMQRANPGLTIEYGGRQKQLGEAFASLPLGFLAAMVMIYVILAWVFASYVQPLAVMLAIPFGLIGVVWGHWIMGYQMTFLSLIGFVALSGVVVNNSLILVEFYNAERRAGKAVREALVDAGKQRLRPIFLTSATTFLGLTPLMLEQSFQARFLIPMAISLSFGLLASTMLVLFVLPCILVIIDDVGRLWHYLWHGAARPEKPRAAPDLASALDES